MAIYSVFSRIFSQKELNKLLLGSLMIFFATTFRYTTICRQSVDSPAPIAARSEILNLSTWKSNVLELNGDIRIHGISSTILLASNSKDTGQQVQHSLALRPYARKGDNFINKYVREWKIYTEQRSPPCRRRHTSIPAVLFSTGGYSGNHFHDFTDLLIPLFLTCREFNGDVVFLVTNKRSAWISKYRQVLQKLSNYDIIEIDKQNKILCFEKVIVGLKAHKEFGIDPLRHPHYSMQKFGEFLRDTYSLPRDSVMMSICKNCARMLIISRRNNRFVTNEGRIADMARGIGFEVVVAETGLNISSVAKLVNSVDVLMGTHGAGLTNMVFLPENALVIQIIPFGAELWARPYFGVPVQGMKLRYLEYRVSLNESSLKGKYPIDSDVYRDPGAIYRKGFIHFHSVYLNNQNVTLNVTRLTQTLRMGMEMLRN